MAIKTNLAALAALIARAIATGGPWVAPKLMLWRSMANTPQPTVADFVEPNYSGYARTDPAWDGPVNYPAGGTGNTVTSVVQGVAPEEGDFVQDTVIGWALLNTAADAVLLWDRFPRPIAVIGPLTRQPFHINVALNQNQLFGRTDLG